MDYKCIIIDLDGVVYKGDELIGNVDERVKALKKRSKVFFLTNNSTLSRAAYVKRLESFGIPSGEKEIITSGYVAARYISDSYENPRVFLIGEKGLEEELIKEGVDVCWRGCNIVLVGLDREVNYRKLSRALREMNNGADFIATNIDSTLITESGLLPGAGAIVSALVTASKMEPTIVGKPSEIMGKMIKEITGFFPRDMLIIGDRIETDVKMGKMIGAKTALVLTGVTSREDVKKSKMKPDYVLESF